MFVTLICYGATVDFPMRHGTVKLENSLTWCGELPHHQMHGADHVQIENALGPFALKTCMEVQDLMFDTPSGSLSGKTMLQRISVTNIGPVPL